MKKQVLTYICLRASVKQSYVSKHYSEREKTVFSLILDNISINKELSKTDCNYKFLQLKKSKKKIIIVDEDEDFAAINMNEIKNCINE